MDVLMPDTDRKRGREATQEAEDAGLPIDTQAGFNMLRMMLPALRPRLFLRLQLGFVSTVSWCTVPMSLQQNENE